MDDRFKDIPEHAVRKDDVSIEMKPGEHPWGDVQMGDMGEGFRAWYELKSGRTIVDVTDAFNSWAEKQPKVHRVTFEWTEDE